MSSRIRATYPSGSRKRGSGVTGLVQNVAEYGDTAAEVLKERERMIHERQENVGRVLEEHDTLLREAFHMEKFVSMLAFDPKVAKEDNSAVFQQFKARFDLVDKTVSAGPSRSTRSAHNARLGALKAAPVPAPSGTRNSKKAGSSSRTAGDDGAFWEIYSEAKGRDKGKGKAVDNPAVQSISAAPGSGTRRGKNSIAEKSASLHKAPVPESISAPPKANIPAQARYPKRSSVEVVLPPPKHGEPARKKRKLDPPADSRSLAPTTRSSALHREATEADIKSPPSPNKSSIRRIKLIVRRPDPFYSNPRQKPLPQKYGGSVSEFLSSYHTLDDEDLDLPALERKAEEDAALWTRIDALRRQGRLLHDPSEFISQKPGPFVEPTRAPNLWDDIILEVQRKVKKRSEDKKNVGALQVPNRIKAYWDSKAAREEKARALEEKRLKALAKSTSKLVIAKWKEAVHHVREEERQKELEEERRRGHEHLDAILAQSGQILEAQQAELAKADFSSRSRSRSSSLLPGSRGWGTTSSSGSEDEDGDTELDEGHDGDTEVAESDEEDAEVDTTLLLGSYQEVTASQETPEVVSQDPHPSGTPDVLEGGVESSRGTIEPSHTSEDYSMGEASPPCASSDPFLAEDQPTPISAVPKETSSVARDSPIPSDPVEVRHNGTIPHVGKGGRLVVEIPPMKPLGRIGVNRKSQQTLVYPSVDLTLTPNQSDSTINGNGTPAPSVSPARRTPTPQPVQGETPHNIAADIRTPQVGDEEKPMEVDEAEDEEGLDAFIPPYLRPFAVAPVEWDSQKKVTPPLLLRGTLRPYQQAGLEWLANIHANNMNGILADEMGLGKTIQTISLLAHLACDRGIWGPHLIIVPTSVLLNWEMEFKKFLPGFKVLGYHGNTKRRKELRQGWNNKYHFNVCVTSYALASRDAHVFKRKPWYYMILDEAHMIKNFKSQRWNTLLMFRSFRRLLLTGTPLQNNLTELWALMQFLLSGTDFANQKEFNDWFSGPLERAIEMSTALDDENQQRVSKLHQVLRPYLLRRLKRDVEKELPQKFEHLIMCPLSKRQRFLYDEFMSRTETRHDLQSGVYQKIANILMQLRKVVNHPDLFEVRPIRTSFAMPRSAIADFEIKELLVRRRLLEEADEDHIDLETLNLRFIEGGVTSRFAAEEIRRLDASSYLPYANELPGEPPPYDTRTIDGYRKMREYQQRAATIARWSYIRYINHLRCQRHPVYPEELLTVARRCHEPIVPLSHLDTKYRYMDTVSAINAAVKSHLDRADEMADLIDRFAFATPPVIARDLPSIAFAGLSEQILERAAEPSFDSTLHRASVKLQIAFPDPSLLQYDCGKLQKLAELLRERKAGGHRVLIFTQMTRVLDILEIFLNFHGYLYLRLDGATKIEDRQYITERFNSDSRIFCFISSSRSGGVGINLTGADTVIFYDSDFNPQMDRQCEDRAHRIGQIRDVHIYRFVSSHTVEEALLRKANQKRTLDDLVIQKGEFDWRSLMLKEAGPDEDDALTKALDDEALTKALEEFADTEDAHAAAVAAREEMVAVGADEADFGSWEGGEKISRGSGRGDATLVVEPEPVSLGSGGEAVAAEDGGAVRQDEHAQEEEEEEGGTTLEYMLDYIKSDPEYFNEWKI
ncbi:hypothetical protein K474DRAFT_1661971 [Panus rudis PR-1116 ss-1]|nr:hypothetical protein K474DRAFT_1661971 [Panus rudis PR-1116 ss-1]